MFYTENRHTSVPSCVSYAICVDQNMARFVYAIIGKHGYIIVDRDAANIFGEAAGPEQKYSFRLDAHLSHWG